MARNLITHIAQFFWKFGFQKPIAFAGHEIFKRIPHVFFDQLGVRAVRKHQGYFLFEHQCTTGHCSHDGETIFGVFGQLRNVGFFRGLDRIEIAQFQLGHAAALFFFHNDVRNVVVVQNFEQIVANARFVVVNVAS